MRAKDFDASTKFYTEVVGFSKGKTWGDPGKRAIMLDAGNHNYIELFEGGSGNEPAGAFFHLALSTNYPDEIIERVKGAGMEITVPVKDVDIPSNPVFPVRIAFFKGPDGEIVEVFKER